MAGYKARQIAAIEAAIVAGRRALRAAERYEPLIFADAYVQAGGVQIPGEPAAEDQARVLGERLLEAVGAGSYHVADRLLQHEIDRVRQETEWVRESRSDRVVGFRLELSSAAAKLPACEALAKEDHGYGRNLFPKMCVVVLPPDAAGSRFYPVTSDEVEC